METTEVYLNDEDQVTINFIKNEQSYRVTMGKDFINAYKIYENADDKMIKSIIIE